MFGMGITEILLIAIVAIIALGPEKLPDAMVQIAKFINKFKNNELNIAELKNEANKFKAQIEDTKTSLKAETKVDLGLNEILNDDFETPKKEAKEIKVENISLKNEDKA